MVSVVPSEVWGCRQLSMKQFSPSLWKVCDYRLDFMQSDGLVYCWPVESSRGFCWSLLPGTTQLLKCKLWSTFTIGRESSKSSIFKSNGKRFWPGKHKFMVVARLIYIWLFCLHFKVFWMMDSDRPRICKIPPPHLSHGPLFFHLACYGVLQVQHSGCSQRISHGYVIVRCPSFFAANSDECGNTIVTWRPLQITFFWRPETTSNWQAFCLDVVNPSKPLGLVFFQQVRLCLEVLVQKKPIDCNVDV